MQSPVVRAEDMFPKEYIPASVTGLEYHETMKRFVIFGIPAAIGMGLSFVAGVALYGLAWWGAATFFVIGLSLFAGLALFYQSYRDQVELLTLRVTKRNDVIDKVLIWFESVNIQTIVVNKGGVLNQGASQNSAVEESTLTEIAPADVNEQYQLASGMMKLGIEAWIDNGMRRPTPKPFSAEIVTAQFHVRREKWMEATQVLNQAGVFTRANAAMWTCNVRTLEDGKRKLDAWYQSKGYIKKTRGNKEEWIK